MMGHKTINKFSFEGEIADDSDFIRIRSEFEWHLVRSMRDDGYVPVIGLGPLFSTKYHEEKNKYSFVLTVYGVYVGKKKVANLEGLDVCGKWYVKE